MPLLYRAISKDDDGQPWVSHEVARGLGVRSGNERPDITPDEDGIVYPGTGGPSCDLSPDRIPFFLKDEPVWSIDTAALQEYLTFREDPDRAGHIFIEPAYPMELEDFRTAIEETRELWQELT